MTNEFAYPTGRELGRILTQPSRLQCSPERDIGAPLANCGHPLSRADHPAPRDDHSEIATSRRHQFLDDRSMSAGPCPVLDGFEADAESCHGPAAEDICPPAPKSRLQHGW
jgi:hypothetical protein